MKLKTRKRPTYKDGPLSRSASQRPKATLATNPQSLVFRVCVEVMSGPFAFVNAPQYRKALTVLSANYERDKLAKVRSFFLLLCFPVA
jgi:hypothetical protein